MPECKRIASTVAAALAVFFAVAYVLADEHPVSTSLRLRLVAVKHGHVESAFGRDPKRFNETSMYKAAASADVDVQSPNHPLLIHSYKNGRLFHLFYDTVDDAFGPADYLIQRVKKTAISYLDAEDAEPQTSVSYLVESMRVPFATMAPDMHFGSYHLGGFAKREILKEFEIGFGEIENVASGTRWPFERNIRYKRIQGYGSDHSTYDKVKYSSSVTWTLRLSFDRDGEYSIEVPELGIHAPESIPDPESAQPQIDAESTDVILEPGRGVADVRIGMSRSADIQRLLGPPLHTMTTSTSAKNHIHRKGLIFNVPKNGPLNTVITRANFGGSTSRGIAHGDTLARVRQVYGTPSASRDDPRSVIYSSGVIFYFDADDKVNRIVLSRPRQISTRAPRTSNRPPTVTENKPTTIFRYKVVTVEEIKSMASSQPKPLETGLNLLGSQGWQLVTTQGDGQETAYVFVQSVPNNGSKNASDPAARQE